MTQSRRRVLAICGGGNGAHALAVIASQTFDGDLVWLVGSRQKADLLRKAVFSADGLRSTGVIAGAAHRVRLISSNAARVIPHADIVAIVAPAFAHAPILDRIEEHLKDGVLVGSLPTRGGFEFVSTQIIRRVKPEDRRVIFGLQTLPWATRIYDPGSVVHIEAVKEKALTATLPRRHAGNVAAELSQIFRTELVPTENFLNMTLGNPGQCIHPALMHGLFAAWDGQAYREENIPRFYMDATEEAGELVQQVSCDIVAVAKAVEEQAAGALDLSGVLSIHDWFRLSYGAQTSDTSSVTACLQTGPHHTIKAPMVKTGNGYVPDFHFRFLTEDVPFGLVITKSIAELADVETPAIDTVLAWAQKKIGQRYLIGGKLLGPDVQRAPVPQNFGITSLMDLIEWYAADSAPRVFAAASNG